MSKFWSQALLREALREQQHPPNWHSPNFIVTGQTFGPKDERQRGQQDPQQTVVLSPCIWEELFLTSLVTLRSVNAEERILVPTTTIFWAAGACPCLPGLVCPSPPLQAAASPSFPAKAQVPR